MSKLPFTVCFLAGSLFLFQCQFSNLLLHASVMFIQTREMQTLTAYIVQHRPAVTSLVLRFRKYPNVSICTWLKRVLVHL